MLIAIAVLSALYVLQMLLFAFAAARAHYPSDRNYHPTVAIIIAARNEEENIGLCLASMVALRYPQNLLEIVVVDDRSTDNTAAIVRSYADRYSRVRLVTALPGNGHMHGKTNAVAQGIEATRGEILLFTDADCVVPQDWVGETVKYYADDSIGIVAGFTDLKGNGWFGEMQTLDWFFLFSVAAATVRLHFPVTAVGTNLSVRRRAYEETGGYRKIPFSVTEDYALFHAVTARTAYKARYPLDPGTLVQSSPCSSVRQLHRQKKRWFRGGRDMEPKYLCILGGSFALNLMLLIGAIVTPSPTVALAGGLKIVVDLIFFQPVLSAFRRRKLLWFFPVFEIYYFLYVLIYPPLVLIAGDVIWKERSFRKSP